MRNGTLSSDPRPLRRAAPRSGHRPGRAVVAAAATAAMLLAPAASVRAQSTPSDLGADLAHRIELAHAGAAGSTAFGAASAGNPPVFRPDGAGISDGVDVAYAPADITSSNILVGDNDQVSMSIVTRSYSDPFTSTDWNSSLTGIVWLLDIDNNQTADRYVSLFKSGGFVFARLYNYANNALLCEGTPGLDPVNRTYIASVPLSCLGGPQLVSLNWSSAITVRTSGGLTYQDFAPDAGPTPVFAGPVASSAYRPKVAANTSYTLQVAGNGGVPSSGVAAVALNVTVTQPDAAGFVTAYPCGTVPNASNLNFVGGQTVPNAIIAPVDPSGRVCLYTSAATHLIADVSGWFPVSANYQAVTPARLVDTRPSGKVAAGSVRTVHVAGVGGVPASNNAAVVLNVTSSGADANGWFTVYPCGAVPNSSNVNYRTGTTVPNLVIAPVDASGNVCIFSSASTHLIVDVNGAFASSGSGFQPLTPQRRYDSRSGARLAAGTTLNLPLASGGIPGSGVSAVSLNVTSTGSLQNGFLTVFPCGSVPNASNVNFVAGADTANAVVAAVTSDTRVCITTSADTHIVVDVNGWFPTGPAGFQQLTPARVLDTR